jgi:hypothetical protein
LISESPTSHVAKEIVSVPAAPCALLAEELLKADQRLEAGLAFEDSDGDFLHLGEERKSDSHQFGGGKWGRRIDLFVDPFL